MNVHMSAKANESLTISFATKNISPVQTDKRVKSEAQMNEEQLLNSIQTAVKSMKSSHTQLEFSEHEGTKRIMVKVIDSDSGDIVREVPPEKTLDLLESLLEMAGILIDEKR